MKDLFNNKYMYLLVSLVMSIWIFISVSAPGSLSTRDATSKQIRETATKVITVKGMALQPVVDSDKYFVTGYPSAVDVELTGSTSLVETTQKTKNFKVSLDLTGLGVGKHKVKLAVTGLNKAITSKVKPEYVTVNIQRKVERIFPIQIIFDRDAIKSGYKVGRATANPDTVKVSGAKSEVNRVVQVVASVDFTKDVHADVDKEVLLQALDKDGKIVNVILEPQTTHVSIPITVPSKKVGLKVTQTGTAADGYEYSFRLNESSAVVYGSEDALDNLSQLEIPIDITNIKKTTTKNVVLSDIFGKQIWEAKPKSVDVTITVTHKEDTDNNGDNSTNDDDIQNTDNNESSK